MTSKPTYGSMLRPPSPDSPLLGSNAPKGPRTPSPSDLAVSLLTRISGGRHRHAPADKPNLSALLALPRSTLSPILLGCSLQILSQSLSPLLQKTTCDQAGSSSPLLPLPLLLCLSIVPTYPAPPPRLRLPAPPRAALLKPAALLAASYALQFPTIPLLPPVLVATLPVAQTLVAHALAPPPPSPWTVPSLVLLASSLVLSVLPPFLFTTSPSSLLPPVLFAVGSVLQALSHHLAESALAAWGKPTHYTSVVRRTSQLSFLFYLAFLPLSLSLAVLPGSPASLVTSLSESAKCTFLLSGPSTTTVLGLPVTQYCPTALLTTVAFALTTSLTFVSSNIIIKHTDPTFTSITVCRSYVISTILSITSLALYTIIGPGEGYGTEAHLCHAAAAAAAVAAIEMYHVRAGGGAGGYVAEVGDGPEEDDEDEDEP